MLIANPWACSAANSAPARWLRAGLVTLMAATGGFGTSLNAANAPLDFRIGAAAVDLPGVKLFSAPTPGWQYHVLSERGATLFVGAVRKQVEEDLCTGEQQDYWYVLPSARQSLAGLNAALIVLGTPSKTDWQALPEPQPIMNEQGPLAEYLQGLLAEQLNQQPIEHALHDLGRNPATQRLAIVLATVTKRSERVSGFAHIRVVIVDVVAEQAVERYQYSVESGPTGELNARIAAVADIDQDGLGDVVLADFGDFYDKVLLIAESGRWRAQTDDWGDPC